MSNKTIKEKAQQIKREKEEKIIPSNIKNGVTIFNVEGNYEGVGSIDLTKGYTFAYSSWRELPEEVINANWSEITSAYAMFRDNSSLISVPYLDLSNVTSIGWMFGNCNSLTNLPEQFNTPYITNMNNTFGNCQHLTAVPMLDTSNVIDMETCFSTCLQITNIPQYNTQSVTNMRAMFSTCRNLQDVPILNTSNVINMLVMFKDCSSLSETSLNNILQMCINAVKIVSNKTLNYIGLTEAQANICKTLSNYSAFLEAGWTTGY